MCESFVERKRNEKSSLCAVKLCNAEIAAEWNDVRHCYVTVSSELSRGARGAREMLGGATR